MEPIDLTLEAANIDFEKMIKRPSEETAEKLHNEAMEKIQHEYVNTILRHLRKGNMPRTLWDRLPKGIQKEYQGKHRFTQGHIAGIPMTSAQQTTDKRKRAKKKRKSRTSKLSRRNNR